MTGTHFMQIAGSHAHDSTTFASRIIKFISRPHPRSSVARTTHPHPPAPTPCLGDSVVHSRLSRAPMVRCVWRQIALSTPPNSSILRDFAKFDQMFENFAKCAAIDRLAQPFHAVCTDFARFISLKSSHAQNRTIDFAPQTRLKSPARDNFGFGKNPRRAQNPRTHPCAVRRMLRSRSN